MEDMAGSMGPTPPGPRAVTWRMALAPGPIIIGSIGDAMPLLMPPMSIAIDPGPAGPMPMLWCIPGPTGPMKS